MSLYHLDSSPIWHFKFPQRHLRDTEHHKFQNKIPTTVLCAFILFGRTIWRSYIKIGSLADNIRIFPPRLERYSHILHSSQLPRFVIVLHIFRVLDKWQISVICDPPRESAIYKKKCRCCPHRLLQSPPSVVKLFGLALTKQLEVGCSHSGKQDRGDNGSSYWRATGHKRGSKSQYGEGGIVLARAASPKSPQYTGVVLPPL